jgi:hypothetical protein
MKGNKLLIIRKAIPTTLNTKSLTTNEQKIQKL